MNTWARRALTVVGVAIGVVGTAASLLRTAQRRKMDAFWRDLIADINCGAVFYRSRLDALASEYVTIYQGTREVFSSAVPGFSVNSGGYACDVDFERQTNDPLGLLRVRINGRVETLRMVIERLRTYGGELALRNIAGPTDFDGNGEVTFTIVVLDPDHKDVLAAQAKIAAAN